ncbi:hypothetical protein PR202_gb22740 [Eleusine coracana subsp. coracana]|uniref:BED-type domain-containing protein n=1 Tax=Eleusine coracana subsp. coracana TaxID=191504 RepID=A0AAV5FH39_ELECO|nr:hypothetical protein PR202_gb22740 [Eleusine coracana subsp. coracana]
MPVTWVVAVGAAWRPAAQPRQHELPQESRAGAVIRYGSRVDGPDTDRIGQRDVGMVKQQKIIRFCRVDPSWSTETLTGNLNVIISDTIKEWGLLGKVFSIILDDAFSDDLVVSNIKANLQEYKKALVDELDRIMEKSSKHTNYKMSSITSVVHYPNCRYAPSMEAWRKTQKVCEILEDFHKHMNFIHNSPSSADIFDKLWDVKKEVHVKADMYRQPHYLYMEEQAFSNVRWEMQKKFNERWKVCFFHLCMEAVVGNTSDDVADEEESTGSVSSPFFSGAMPKKRLRSKVWDDFIPTFVDGKIAGAQCMHCCRTFNCTGTTGTTSLRNHLARCSPETQKRPRKQEHTPLPSTQKGTTVGSDPKQKRLPFLLSRQTKCDDTADAMPLQEIVLPNIGTKKNRKNQEVDRNGCHEELAEPEFSTDHNQKNQSHEQTALSEQDIPNDTSRKNQKVDQKLFSLKNLSGLLAIHGHLPKMMEKDGFWKFEKSKLKEKLAALCGRNQQKIIKFSPMDSSCSARELSDVILGAIREWGLDGKVFSIILDDAFVDDSVASDVKVTQVGLDELEKIKEKSAKCSKYRKESNCRNVPSPEGWKRAKNICEILEDCYMYIELMPTLQSPAYLFDKLKKVFHKADFYSQLYKSDEAFSIVLERIKQKSKERWNFCFLHFCMPMVMDPEYSLKGIKPHVRDKSKDDYIHKVRDTFLSLFNEYSDQVDDPNCSSGSETSNGTVLDEDTLSKYYHDSKNQICERPMTELCQYLQEQHPRTMRPKPSVLQWWKEHSLTYPTIARMARDILALPCSTDCNIAIRTAGVAMCEPASERHIEMLVCTQDWLTPAGTTCALASPVFI